MLFIKILSESFLQALHQLWSNRLRSILSLLGIAIGIFCIISVLSMVDSLERNIRESIQRLGDDIVYVDRVSWTEDPNQNFWKYLRRPFPGFKDFTALERNVKSADMVAYGSVVGTGKSLEYRSENVSNVFVFGMTYDYGEMFNFEFQKGRYLSRNEYHSGADLIILGANIADALFGPKIDPVGRTVKVMGRKLRVVGVLKKGGDDLLQVMNFDDATLVSFNMARKLTNVRRDPRGVISIKAKEGVSLDKLEDEITAVMRAHRRLKPKQDNNFSLNTLSLLSNAFDGLFGVLNLAGFVIGGFAIFVGIFGVANIMFVSVKERTNIIGIKKALGARRYVILLEFLIESIVLCILGGILGLLMVFGVVAVLTELINFNFVLATNNILIGLGLSVGIGLIAGIIPASVGASMNPVDAIRS